MLDLYGEQVAGFYDPDSTVLYVVRGAEPLMVRLILAHELVHALQDQYTHLNAILKLRRQNDRQMAGQAVAEGQATLASIQALAPGADLSQLSRGWEQTREAIRSQQAAMPVFAAAPHLVQEDLIFPYLAGLDFVRAFDERRTDPHDEPYGDRMPVSTEQVLHPSKYTAHERPARVRLAVPAGDTLIYDDDFGEFDTRTALEAWGANASDAVVAASGWNGDRFEVLGGRSGTTLVWAVAWDSPAEAAEFERALRQGWQRRTSAAEGSYAAAGSRRRWRGGAPSPLGVAVVRLTDAPAAVRAGWRSGARAVTVTPPGSPLRPLERSEQDPAAHEPQRDRQTAHDPHSVHPAREPRADLRPTITPTARAAILPSPGVRAPLTRCTSDPASAMMERVKCDVAVAMWTGKPRSCESTGTWTIPPPMPRRLETNPTTTLIPMPRTGL